MRLISLGTSETERDTIPGRQCMASFHYLSENWDDVLLYLRSIEVFLFDYCFSYHFCQEFSMLTIGMWSDSQSAFVIWDCNGRISSHLRMISFGISVLRWPLKDTTMKLKLRFSMLRARNFVIALFIFAGLLVFVCLVFRTLERPSI